MFLEIKSFLRIELASQSRMPRFLLFLRFNVKSIKSGILLKMVAPIETQFLIRMENSTNF